MNPKEMPANVRGEKAEPAHEHDAVWRMWQGIFEKQRSQVDPIGMFAPIMHAHAAWLAHPLELAERMTRTTQELIALQVHAARRLAGGSEPDVVLPNADDQRFADPVWTDSAGWDVLKEWYLFYTRNIQDALFEAPGLAHKERRRAAFWWRKWLNMVAPTNFFLTNPVAVRKAIESSGQSLQKGIEEMLADLQSGGVRMTSPEDFEVGVNLATTPGEVVFRNHLIELIRYTPVTAKVHETPIVIVTPWINKFYVLDLTPKKSMVQYLLKQGFSVFIVSWKNPTAEMAGVTFDDYLTDGVDAAVNVARATTGAKRVHAVGYCIGGTLLSTYMAWLNKRHAREEDVPVAHWTLFTTLTDFQSPGDIEVFLDEASVNWICDNMKKKGFLDGKEMASTFRLMRSNSLIWHYVVHGWLYGEKPPPFDVLFWNMDTTRMPAAMHEYYLREMYLKNHLIEPAALTIAGEPISLKRIRQPLYAVSAEDDHVAPWRQTFRINQWVQGPKRYVLSSSGHILGIVNPPANPPKRKYWVGPAHRRNTADGWHADAELHDGTWWEDWVAWLRPQCGPLIDAPPVSSKAYPKLADAPGTYVLET